MAKAPVRLQAAHIKATIAEGEANSGDRRTDWHGANDFILGRIPYSRSSLAIAGVLGMGHRLPMKDEKPPAYWNP